MIEFNLNGELILWVAITSFPVLALIVAILLDFILFEERNDTKKSKRSLVATGTMFLFYGFYMLAIVLRILVLTPPLPLEARYFGVALLYLGSAMNIWGRVVLKNNWANHIKIYSDHRLITHSVFKIVRHPLYTSLFVMMFGGALFFSNLACFLLTAFVFIPMMYYRAKQEEKLLCQEFPEYENYRRTTGMFFPKPWR